MRGDYNLGFCICIVGFLDLMAVSMVVPLLLAHIIELGTSPTLAGLISSIYGGVQLFSSPMMGKWSDRIGRHKSLLFCLLLISAGYALLGFAVKIPMLIVARCLLGFCKHSQTLCKTYLSDGCPKDKQAKVFGYFNATSSLGFILGPSIAGHLAEMTDGFYYVCWVVSSLYILSAGLVWLFLPPLKTEVIRKPGAESKTDLPLEHVAWISYWDLFSLCFFLSLAPMLYRNNFNLMLKSSLGLSKAHVGYIVSFQGLASALCGFSTGLFKNFYSDNRKLTIKISLLQSIAILLLTFCTSITQLVCFLIPLCLSNTLGRVSVMKLIVDRTDPKHTGVVIGSSQSLTSLARMISPLFAGILYEWSIYGPGIIASMSSFAAAIVLLLTSRDIVLNSLSKKEN